MSDALVGSAATAVLDHLENVALRRWAAVFDAPSRENHFGRSGRQVLGVHASLRQKSLATEIAFLARLGRGCFFGAGHAAS